MPKRASLHQAMRCVALRGGLGVLYGGDGVRGRNADVLTLYLGEGGRRDTGEEHGGGDNG